jgi:hypothetical protein
MHKIYSAIKGIRSLIFEGYSRGNEFEEQVSPNKGDGFGHRYSYGNFNGSGCGIGDAYHSGKESHGDGWDDNFFVSQGNGTMFEGPNLDFEEKNA